MSAAGTAGPPAAVAAFDFDGTLTRADTFLPFLVSVCGVAPVVRAVAAALPRARSRNDLKAAVVRQLLTGRDLAELDRAGRAFGARLVERSLVGPARERLRWHRDQGHATLLVSASPRTYLDEVGRLLGVTDVVSTTLGADDAGRASGELAGGNCRGPEKARRVQAWIDAATPPGAPRPVLWAYGDSAGDRELLALAQRPHRLRRGRFVAARPG